MGYSAGQKPKEAGENCRNGYSEKTLQGEHGEVTIEIPRDRAGQFEPKLVRKGQRRFDGFDEKIIAMCARGMTVREIQGYLQDQYKVDVSPDLISSVTNAVPEDMKAWQTRPLERIYPVVFFDALRVKIRDEGSVKNKAVYLALGAALEGTREVLELWIERTRAPNFGCECAMS